MRWFILSGFLIAILQLMGQNPTVEPLGLNSKAPDFRLPGTDGKTYSLESFEEFPILAVIFTCNHCPTAQAYEDRIIEMVNEYRPRGVGFVAISTNDPKAISLSELGYSDLNDDLKDMKIRAREKGFNFPYLYDGETQKASLSYGPATTPQVFIFDEDRRLRYRGRIDDTENPYVEVKRADMKMALNALLNGEEIAEPLTKTFGCSTKWSWKRDWVEKEQENWRNEPVELKDLPLEAVDELISNPGENLRLINFWATWCGPCIIEFPDFVDINRMYRNRDFEFISVSTDKPGRQEKVLKMLEKFEASNLNYQYTGDDIYQLIEAVDPEWQGPLPYTILIAPGGEKIFSVQGTIDPQALKTKIVEKLGRFYADD